MMTRLYGECKYYVRAMEYEEGFVAQEVISPLPLKEGDTIRIDHSKYKVKDIVNQLVTVDEREDMINVDSVRLVGFKKLKYDDSYGKVVKANPAQLNVYDTQGHRVLHDQDFVVIAANDTEKSHVMISPLYKSTKETVLAAKDKRFVVVALEDLVTEVWD
ncbi:putative hexapeptide repeat containing transferase-like protein [Bacillus phage Bp8p-C]|uniref:Putative hexapeptide repeat containing transferase-like protein n=2 Tax=Agatevirus Bp8pC TaxID=1910937 RepID=A0A0A0PJG0_9CAUD|nr:putative hexapeptide repeat containing transferase-like protein [Bacillus phage Bp8p-C]YP_009784508.1 putative hexapeptide repeat containing transferase-like protein [Bacillus phage Bp8p-T]AHJ87638.1 putative hexapeptide repeat containing transferase-like protein [Bacillus phage Bp8p-C]AHJ87849.1 putative hexapeptide repeat containing transferase-like protein [Bacillus phage Bp8p-T]